ncbi:hypothetical protein K3495_g16321, partial [Podosphaera aphanis]
SPKISPNDKVVLNIEKRAQYLRDEATAIDLLFRSLTQDDQALYDEYDSAYSLWSYLQSKYRQTDPSTANEYMTNIQLFKLEDMTIVEAWDKLKDYRRKLCAADSGQKDTYRDPVLLLILIRALPKDYTATIDTIDAQTGLSVEEKLKRLQLKETRMATEARNEGAFAGSFKSRGGRKPASHQRMLSDDSDEPGFSPPCYICEKKHFVKACPFMDIARTAVRDHIRRIKSDQERSAVNRRAQTRPRSPTRPKSIIKQSKKVDFKGKGKAYEASTLTDSDDNFDFSSDDLENCEHAQISRALIS